jgi:hypothetical protein
MRPRDQRSIRSVECAVWRYANAIRQGSSPCRADRNADSQTANFREAAERAELRAEQIRHILNERGVSLVQFVSFRGFGLHVDKLCRDYSGETLRARALDAVLRWQCYGCNPDVLRAIAATVFSLDLSNPSESRKP